MEKCTCFDDLLEKVKTHIKSKLPENTTEFYAEYENVSFVLASGDFPLVNPRIKYEYRQMKRDGSPAKNLTKDSVTMFCSYCPFCGRKYEKDGKEAA